MSYDEALNYNPLITSSISFSISSVLILPSTFVSCSEGSTDGLILAIIGSFALVLMRSALGSPRVLKAPVSFFKRRNGYCISWEKEGLDTCWRKH